LPPHIDYTKPSDGSTVSKIQSVCAGFSFREGNGFGRRPVERIRFYLDGRDVTDRVDALITLNTPPSAGLVCSKFRKPLSPGWHTAKVVYRDLKEIRFEYSWRFIVQ